MHTDEDQIARRELLQQVFADLKINPDRSFTHCPAPATSANSTNKFSNDTQRFLGEQLPQADPELIAEYLLENQTRKPLEQIFGPLPDYKLLSEAEFREIFSDRDGWKHFREKFPKSAGNVMVSAPVISKEPRKALIEVGMQLDWLAGQGRCFLYAHDGTRWSQVKQGRTWVS